MELLQHNKLANMYANQKKDYHLIKTILYVAYVTDHA